MSTCAECEGDLPAGARFCPSCGAVASAPATEERKLATVLFADLVGSTALGEQDPERTRVLLDRFYDAMAAEVEATGGTLEKFVGDAVMAAFGAPAAREDHAERALHTALAMQRRLAELFGDELALRIGVNTGEVVVGRARAGSSFVTGDAVNVAARLEQAAQAREILAGERTVAAVRGAFEFGELQTVDAKGKSEPVTCRRVVRALSLMRPKSGGGIGSAFVGRDSELDLLRATFARAVDRGEPHLVTIVGDAGVGKTRLVRELWEWLSAQAPQPHMRTGRCLAYGHATYWPLGEILKEHLGVLESDPPETALRHLRGREILGLALGLDVAADLHPLAARDRLHDAWVTFLGELTSDRPAVVLVEDLHWAEEPLLELFERALRDVRGPLLVIGTSRPELFDGRSNWGAARRNASSIWLEPLAARDAEAIVHQLPPRIRGLVVERAEGNPFFLEEIVASLVDQGALVVGDDGWRTVEDAPIEVPDSVQALLASRIDLLAPPLKAALQAAAVIGRVFWPASVEALLGEKAPALEPLEDRDFIRRRTGSSFAGEIEYAFKHSLTREVAYGTLPKARRAHLHARFAEWLEALGGRDEHAPLLAYHYSEAARPDDVDLAWPDDADTPRRLQAAAVRWLGRAGTLAAGRFELDEALLLLHRALELEPDDDTAAALWREVGRAQALRFDGTAFWSAMEQSLALSDDPDEQAATLAELAYQTSFRVGMFRTTPERELVNGWIDRALELAQPETSARAKALLARVFWEQTGRLEDAEEASRLADRLGDQGLRSAAWRATALTHLSAGNYDDALTWTQRSFDLIDYLSDPEEAVEAYELMVPTYVALGRFDEARRASGEHDRLLRALTPHHRVHAVALILELEELLGGWETVRSLRERTENVVRENAQTPCGRNARSLLTQALAHEYNGDRREARRLEQAAEETGVGNRLTTGPLLTRLALARGDLDSLDPDELDPASRRHFVWFGFSSTTAQLDAFAALGRRDDVERAAEPYLDGHNRYFEPFALRALGRVRGDTDLVRRSILAFEALGLEWHATQTRASL
jgi:class 3 adenylate cyclase/tetratricopeptide (TPR) repeat protein